MKLSWILVILLLVFVAIFSVQNADPITVRFIKWEISMSAALIIQLAAMLGGLVGLTAGAMSRHARHKVAGTATQTASVPHFDSPNRTLGAPTDRGSL
jgi:uncharacterized integral membrane protein